MHSTVSSVVSQLKPYFDGLIREEEGTGALYIYDEELADRASCCTTGEVASFYLLDAKLNPGDGKEIARRLADDVRRRQLPQGAFGQPYYVKKGESGTVDIAEIGAVANSLYHLYKETASEAARSSLEHSARYLLTQVAKENPGAVYKNPNATGHDVLNGDIYAAHTLARAYQVTGEPLFRDKTEEIVCHVAERFGKHEPGWWPYTELWDGSVGMGNSVAYQGTIIAFAYPLIPLLSPALRDRWQGIAKEAVTTMLRAMEAGPNDFNEAPWWCRDWDNAWEIWLAFARYPEWDGAGEYAARRLKETEASIREGGASCFRPKVKSDDPERSPVTTTFRKAATFAGLLAYQVLDCCESDTALEI
ncbi:hypothetical protein [Paenibacillus sp. J2TS4]|uniref:hypothetical protein n=1 Tax=Paenibacillus sp. J2TS4 TaxID=2807194 RepID=UPI001B286363|nr:hypothetical protein [Paenibacillus sp. J2TS4]GIP36141.1 hypothetical protein J2TS4_53510 [Paenibacillus sp. J2TS4]